MRPGPRTRRTPRWQLSFSLLLVALCQFVSGPAHEFLHSESAHVEHDPSSSDGCVHLRGEAGHEAGPHEQHPCLTCHTGRAGLALAPEPAGLGLALVADHRLPAARPDRDRSVVPEGILGARGPPCPSV